MSRLDWTIVRTAATAGLLVLVPGAFGAALVVDDGAEPGWAWLFVLIIAIGFTAAGYVAGRLRPATPMLHGAVAALVAFAVAQVIGTVAGLAANGDIEWAAVAVTGALAVTLGVAGALLGDLAHRRRPSRAGR